MRNLNRLIFACGLGLLLYGCTKESLDTLPRTESGLILNYSVADMTDAQGASTRGGMSAESSEREIKEMIMLFFESQPDNSGAFIGSCIPTIVNELPNGWEVGRAEISKENVSVKLDKKKDYRVWVIANYEENGLKQTDLLDMARTAATEETLKRQLKVSNSTSLVAPLLMSASGMMSGNDFTCTVTLQRNVARIEIINEIPAKVGKDFKLMSIQMGNMRESSYIMDLDGEFPVDYALQRGNQVTAADKKEGALMLSTYAFETFRENPKKDDMGTLCVIVEGEMNGLRKYYRLNINASEESQRIKRNAKYTLRLVDVLGWGMDTPDEAMVALQDILLISEGQFWDELFDGVYTYSSNGKGFATDKNEIKRSLLTFTGLEDSKKNGDIELFWSNKGVPMKAPGDNEVTVSVDNEKVVKVEKKSSSQLHFTLLAFGSAQIKITYGGATRTIPVEVTTLPISSIQIDNVIVASYNVGRTIDSPNGKYFSASQLGSACPPGWRLPIVSELQLLDNAQALKITENGFLLINPTEDAVTLIPFAGKQEGTPKPTEVGDYGYYWTGSSTDSGKNRILFSAYKNDNSISITKTVDLSVVENRTTQKYPVRCVATVDATKPVLVTLKDQVVYEVKSEWSIGTDAGLDNTCGRLGTGWKFATKFPGISVSSVLDAGSTNIDGYMYNVMNGDLLCGYWIRGRSGSAGEEIRFNYEIPFGTTLGGINTGSTPPIRNQALCLRPIP